MIEWLYMLASLLAFGFANFFRKIILKGAEPTEAPFWESVGYIPAILFVLLTVPLTFSTEFLLLCLASGLLAAVAVTMLYWALKDGYVSTVTAIANLNTHVAAFLAFIILAEAFTPRLVLGILLAALVIILFAKSKTIKPGKWLAYSLLALLFFALKNLVDKTLSMGYDPMFAFAMVSIFSQLLLVLRYS